MMTSYQGDQTPAKHIDMGNKLKEYRVSIQEHLDKVGSIKEFAKEF